MNNTVYEHVPVLLERCVDGLNIKPEGIYFDGTCGGGGHSRAIAEKLSSGRLICADRDADAIEAARAALAGFGNVTFVKSKFSEIDFIMEQAGVTALDGALLDLGVSSYHLDNPARGFSYMSDGPLDMRMDSGQALTARDVVNGCGEDELARIFYDYGEERWALRIAQFVVNERRVKPIETTFELVSVIKKAVPKSARQDGIHPAKRVFQAIRIEVNEELDELGAAIDGIISRLNRGGRLCVCSFHSLEDRIVKKAIKSREDPCSVCESPVGDPCAKECRPSLRSVTKKPVTPDEAELSDNRRARSTKLRIAEKL